MSYENDIGGNNSPSPQFKQDRNKSLLSSYTSEYGECPFYVDDDPKIRSKCTLDPKTPRNWDCKGVCYFQGRCCKILIDHEEKSSDYKSR